MYGGGNPITKYKFIKHSLFIWVMTSSLAPRRQRGSPFCQQQAQELSEGTFSHIQNTQWQKKHNQQNDTKII